MGIERRINGEQITDNEFSYNKDWFGRVMVGGMALVGIVGLAVKMGGPTGKAIAIAADTQSDNLLSKMEARGREITGKDNFHVSDFRTSIDTNVGTFKFATLPNSDQTGQAFKHLFDADSNTESVLKAINNAEEHITNVILGNTSGNLLHDEMLNIKQYYDPTVTINSMSGTNYVIAAARLETLQRFTQEGIDNQFGLDVDFYDFQDIEMGNNVTNSDLQNIHSRHKNLVADNKRYQELYKDVIGTMSQQVTTNADSFGVAKNSTYAENGIIPLSQNSIINNSVKGDLAGMISAISEGAIQLENYSTELYSSKSGQSQDVISQKVNSSLSDPLGKNITHNAQVMQYSTNLSKIAAELQTAVSVEGSMADIHIELVNYGSQMLTDDYFEITLISKGPIINGKVSHSADKVAIPITTVDGYSPRVDNTAGVGLGNSSHVTHQFGNALAESDGTNRMLETFLSEIRQITKSKLNNGHTSVESVLSLLKKRFKLSQASIAPMEHTLRDVYKRNVIEDRFEAEMHGLTTQGKKNRMADYKSGVQAYHDTKQMIALGKQAQVITLDFETIQLIGTGVSSPTFMPARETTAIWSAGLSISNGDGTDLRIQQISSAHALSEHGLTDVAAMVGARNNEGALKEINSLLNSKTKIGATGRNLSEFSGYIRDSLGMKATETDADVVLKFVKDVLAKADTSTQNYSSTVEFGNDIIDQIISTAKSTKKKTYLRLANGKNFDLHLLQTLTSRLPELKDYVEIIDVTDLRRTLIAGLPGFEKSNVVSTATDMMQRAFPQLAADAGFKGFQTSDDIKSTIKFLSGKGILSTGANKESAYSILHTATGGNIEAHASAATDVMLLDVIHAGTIELFGRNIDDTAEQVRYVSALVDQYSQKRGSKTAADYAEMQNMNVFNREGMFQGLSLVQQVRGKLSTINPAFFNPFWAINPLAKQLHQFGNTPFIAKDRGAPAWRHRAAISGSFQERTSQFAYQTAGMDANRFGQHLVMRTVSLVGGYGGQEGIGVTSAKMEHWLDGRFATNVTAKLKTANYNEGAGTALMSNRIFDFMTKTMSTAVGESAKADGFKLGTKTTKTFLELAFREELAKMKGGGIELSGADAIGMEMMLGDEKVTLRRNEIANIVGIELGVDPNDNRVSNITLQIARRGSGKNAIGNVHGGKTVRRGSTLDQDILEKAAHARNIEAPEYSTSLEVINKDYHGTMKSMAFEHIVYTANDVLNDPKYRGTATKKDAIAALKHLAGLMEPLGGATYESVDGFRAIRMKDEFLDQSAHKIAAGASSISLTDIMGAGRYIGDELVWNYQQMKTYYNLFGGGEKTDEANIKRGAKQVNKLLVAENDGYGGTKSANADVIALVDEHRKLANPMKMVEHNLRENKKYKQYKNLTLDEFLGLGDEAIKVINGMRVPKLYHDVMDVVAMEKDGVARFGLGTYTIKEITMSGGDKMSTWETNADITLRHGYFNNMLTSPFVTDMDKDIMMSSTGYKSSNRDIDLVKSVTNVVKAMNDNSISSLVAAGAELDLDALDQVLTKKHTIDKLKKKLAKLKKSKHNAADILKIEQILATIDPNLVTEDIKNQIIREKVEYKEAAVELALENNSYISNGDAHMYTDLAGKDNMRVITGFQKGGMRAPKSAILDSNGDQFRIDLDKLGKQYEGTEGSRNPLQIKAIKRFYNNQRKLMGKMSAADKKNMLMFMDDDGMLVMNGFVVPKWADTSNIMNNIDDELGDQFGRHTDEFRMVADFEKSFLNFRQEMLDGKADIAEQHRMFNDTAFEYFNMMSNVIDMGKDSRFNKGAQSTILKGTNAHYDVTDSIVEKAKAMVEGFEQGDKNPYQRERMKKLFKNKSAEEIMNFKKHVSFIANADSFATFASSSNIFNDQKLFNQADGTNITWGDMYANADKDLRFEMDKIKKGHAVAGGLMTRFPTEPSAQLGLIQSQIIGMSDMFMEAAGIDSQRLYMQSALGALQKADTDGDRTNLMMLAFNTVKGLDKYREQVSAVHKHLSKFNDFTTTINLYNQKGLVIRTDQGPGETQYTIGQMTHDGKLVEKTMGVEQYMNEYENNMYAKTLKKLGGVEFAHGQNLNLLAHAIENHSETASLATSASVQIGAVTATMRERTRDLITLKKVAPGNSLRYTELFGSIESGLGVLTQLSIKMGKHDTTAEDAARLSRVSMYLQDPTRTDRDAHALAEGLISKFYKDTDEYLIPEQIQHFNNFIDSDRAVLELMKQSPEAGAMRKAEGKIINGSETASVYDLALIEQIDNDDMMTKFFDIEKSSVSMMHSLLGKADMLFKKETDFDAIRAIKNKGSLLFQKYNEHKFDDLMTSKGMRSGGRFAAGAAIGMLAASFFTPMVGTNVGSIDSKNNFLNSELELHRDLAIDTVNASFSKEAFVYMNDLDQSKFNKAKGASLSDSLFKNNIFKSNHNSKISRNPIKINRINAMGYVGPFGSSEHNRYV